MSNALGEIKLEDPITFPFKELVSLKDKKSTIYSWGVDHGNDDYFIDLLRDYVKNLGGAIDGIQNNLSEHSMNDARLQQYIESKKFPQSFYCNGDGKKLIEFARSSPDVTGYDIIRSDYSLDAIRERIKFSPALEEALYIQRPDLAPQFITEIGPEGIVQTERPSIDLNIKSGASRDLFTLKADYPLEFSGFDAWHNQSVAILFNPQTKQGVFVKDASALPNKLGNILDKLFPEKGESALAKAAKEISTHGVALQAYLLTPHETPHEWPIFQKELASIMQKNPSITFSGAELLRMREPEKGKSNFALEVDKNITGAVQSVEKVAVKRGGHSGTIGSI